MPKYEAHAHEKENKIEKTFVEQIVSLLWQQHRKALSEMVTSFKEIRKKIEKMTLQSREKYLAMLLESFIPQVLAPRQRRNIPKN